MVFYFKVRPEAGDYTIFMGLDKFENEDLIKYGFPEDIWFHVDKMSSAHVYLRLNKGQTMDDISEETYCREEMERLEKEKQAEIRSYKNLMNLMVQEKMTSNKQVASGSKTLEELEDDFM
uniref:NFACT RNA-binding domain-containing protein n=1 Tax=Oryza glumipatula TaxID=40148 RepID=A0A0D9ZVV0_9ORYZ